jgi:hypothetical protein
MLYESNEPPETLKPEQVAMAVSTGDYYDEKLFYIDKIYRT